MSTKEQIKHDLKVALKERQEIRLSTLRLLLSEIHNLEIQKRKPVTDDDCFKVLSGALKKRRESAEQFLAGNREDLATKEEAEAEIIQSYMPQALSDEELKTVIESVIKESGAAHTSDFGRVMKAVMEKVKGRAEGIKISQMVKALLT